MQVLTRRAVECPPLMRLGALALLVSLGGAAHAAPSIRVTPPDGARFLPDQRFDVRVEFKPSDGATLQEVSFSIDGRINKLTPQQLDADGGFTLRNMSSTTIGAHAITASATDSATPTPVTATSNLQVIPVAGNMPKARNVIILLGDGMGISHRTAARIMRYGVTRGHANGLLAMDQFPISGMVMTHSLNSIITDSAPGMSSYVSGNKNANGQEGVYPDNTKSAWDNPRVEYLSEYLHRTQNKALGIVTTADVEDATPAANAIHTSNRGFGTGICDQYLDEADLPPLPGLDPPGAHRGSGLQVLMGGGRRWFLPAKKADGSPNFGSSRADASDYVFSGPEANALGIPTGALDANRDLIGDFQKAGFAYASSLSELKNPSILASSTTKLLGLFGYGNMNVAYDKLAKRRNPSVPGVVDDYHAPDQPMLDEMTEVALDVLNRHAEGFVLMVEGAHIDKQSHLMDPERAIFDTIEFDNAIRKCAEFAQRVGNTTVIITSDHECGGFSIIGAAIPTTNELRAMTGKDALQKAVGTYDAAGFPQYTVDANGYPIDPDADHKMLIGFGANADRNESWLARPLPVIDSLLSADIVAELKAGGTATKGAGYAVDPIDRDKDKQFLIIGQVPGTQAVHTASDIPINGLGIGAAQFVGVQDNTDVFFKLARCVLGGY
jgi:alkaline phosphatase